MTCQFRDHFHFFCQKVIPLVYDESLSYYEVVCKLTDYIHKLSTEICELDERMDEYENISITLWPEFKADVEAKLQAYEEENAKFQEGVNNELQQAKADLEASQNAFQAEVEKTLGEFESTLNAIKNGEYVDLYLDSIKTYIDDNLKNFVSDIVKFVSFGLTNDGRFAAYIPETWRFLTFSTITDPTSPLYNHLVFTY